MSVRIFALPAVKADPAFHTISSEFSTYLNTGNPGKYFGRDEPYTWRVEIINAALRHVHLLDPADWHTKYAHLRRQFDRKSNQLLVYCRAESDQSCVALIALERTDAHEKAKSGAVMDAWVKAAEDFHRKIRAENQQ